MSRRRRILAIIAVAVLATAAATVAIRAKGSDGPAYLTCYSWRGANPGVFGDASATMLFKYGREDMDAVLWGNDYFMSDVKDLHPRSDVTVRKFNLALEARRPRRLAEVANRVISKFGAAKLEETDVRPLMPTSEKVYLRLTPDGKCYLSSAEDREHMLSPGFLKLDEYGNFAPGAMRAFWRSWLEKADAITRKPSGN